MYKHGLEEFLQPHVVYTELRPEVQSFVKIPWRPTIAWYLFRLNAPILPRVDKLVLRGFRLKCWCLL